tara:strand:+ start:149 stop:517 length:369 start_codon:yes stop_codon:yes gene_type:complete
MTKAKELSELASAATVTSGNVALSGGLDVDGVTDSSSSTSGALIVDGGVGIAKKLFVGTNVTAPKFLTTATKIETAIFRVNDQTLSANTTIAADENANATGPLTVASGVTLTVTNGGNLSIV